MNAQTNKWAVGWSAFSGAIMIVLGIWHIIAGFAAIFGDGEFYVATGDWVFKLDASTWGWIHMLVGVVVLLAGIGVFRGAAWARAVGVIIAMIAGVFAFAWLPWFPVWAILFIAISVAVIWALTVHGHDIAEV